MNLSLELIKPIAFSTLRHFAGVWGAWLATHNGLGTTTEDQFTGAIMVIGAVCWSYMDKAATTAIKAELARLAAQFAPANDPNDPRPQAVGASTMLTLKTAPLVVILSLVVVGLGVVPALAQVTPVANKPPPVVSATPVGTNPLGYPSGTGFYVGAGTFLETSSSTISTAGGASTNLNSAGGALNLLAGWQYKYGFVQGELNYTNLGGSANCGNAAGGTVSCSIAGPWGFGIGTAVWFDWTYVLSAPTSVIAGWFGGQTPLNLLPSGLTISSMAPYAGIWVDINSLQGNINGVGASTWEATPELRFGSLVRIQNGGVLDPHIGYEFADTSFGVGPGGSARKGPTIRAGVDYKF